MIKNSNLILLILLTFVFTSCIYQVKDFTVNELKWFKPYDTKSRVIFISGKNELDTINFYKTVTKSDSVRSFELGFYNMNYLTVPYSYTKGSYHQSALMGQGKTRYEQEFAKIWKSSSGNSTLEITFIGTIFNGEELKKIKKVNENIYFFDSKKATYSGMNVEEGIKDFTFDTRVGITNYTDNRGVRWKRK